MPHTKSAKKNLRKAEKRLLRNRATKKSIKTQIKKFEAALDAGNLEVAQREFALAAKKLDKAGARRIIHPNTASRNKSRLATVLHQKVKAGKTFHTNGAESHDTNGSASVPRHSQKQEKPRRRRTMEPFVEELFKRAVAGMLHEPTEEAKQRLRASLYLQYHYPARYVAYIDAWQGGELQRRVLAEDPALEGFSQKIKALPEDERAQAKVTFVRPLDSASAFAPFDLPRLAPVELPRVVQAGEGRQG